jgi:chromosome segregation ATPase
MTEEQFNQINKQLSSISEAQARIIKKIDSIQTDIDKLERNHKILADDQDILLTDVKSIKNIVKK